MSRSSRTASELLLGEWACLGIVAQGPTHGFAVAISNGRAVEKISRRNIFFQRHKS